MPYLEIRLTTGKKRLKLSGRVLTIGRHPDNLLVLPDDRASRHHAVIEPIEEGTWVVRDLGSANGTKLNQERIDAREFLDNGDVVRIGKAEMRFIDPDQRAPHKRKQDDADDDVPDFAAAIEERAQLADAATLDIDIHADAAEAQTGYEKRLAEIIESAKNDEYTEEDISLIDSRGATIHQASSSGVQSGSSDEAAESVRLFRLILCAAFKARATDIHVEPRQDDATIRMRVDGYMIPATDLSMPLFQRLLGMIKILCQIDTSRKAVVQDGHFAASVKGRRVDFRVSLTPSMHGQKLVVRVLDSSNAPSRLHELGLNGWMYEKLRTVATKDAGLLLACGPTGSGKTTSLYSCLREIDVDHRNAITIEDPVEYYLEGCTQIPIDHNQGNTFANILRSVLRQDPDVIFVGEIRDIETATVAMQAAMTGHLVYSTVHAKDSIGAIFRLLDLGVESFLVANALNLILAQRLVRVLCPTCKKPVRPTPAQVMKMGNSLEGMEQIFVPTGCRRCLRTGFHGRRALFELLEINDAMRDVILKSPSIQGLRDIANQGLFMTLQQYGFSLVAEGDTAMAEIERVSGSG